MRHIAISPEGRWVVTTYHPSYVLRVPGEDARRQAFQVMVESLKLDGVMSFDKGFDRMPGITRVEP